MTTPAAVWDAFTNPINDGPGQTWTHIRLSLFALALAAAIAVPSGLVLAKLGKAGSAVTTLTSGLGRAVPTFAVMALVAALFTIGFWPAVVGLVLLGIPPILLNTVVGIREVDPGAVEASRGMGLTAPQVMRKVELPLSLPLIFAGLRLSTNQVVATAALAGFVGAGGLGVIVQSGLFNGQEDVLLAGAIPIAILAILAQLAISGVERAVSPKGLRLTRAARR